MGGTIIFLKGGRCVLTITPKIHAQHKQRKEHLPILLPPKKVNNRNLKRVLIVDNKQGKKVPSLVTPKTIHFRVNYKLKCPPEHQAY